MKRLTVSENEKKIVIRDFPSVVSIEPFQGSLSFPLSVQEGKKFRAVCSHLHGEEESYTIPHYCHSFREVPKCYLLLTHDTYGATCYFCLSHQDQSSYLISDGEQLSLQVESGSSKHAQNDRIVLLVDRGPDVYELIKNTMQNALQLTGGLGRMSGEKSSSLEWLERLGWESGIAFGSEVSHEKVVKAISELRQSGFRPGYVLVDEGWQQLAVNPKDQENREALHYFDADRNRFPLGLKGLVDDLRQEEIHHVGVWHGMMGSREGVHPDLAHQYQLPSDSEGRCYLGDDLGTTFQFFYDYYGYLREQGITFIKVGDQSRVKKYCAEGVDPTKLYRHLQSAMQAAASIQFNSAHFNAECLRNENLYYWTTSQIARTAHDIDIQNPVGVMRTIRNNLFNSLWMQHLMLPDFDAWMTDMPHSESLAIFHALSGSINVIGDPPGGHNHKLIQKMQLPSGKLLMGDHPLTLCQNSVFTDPLKEKIAYKAFTRSGESGVVALFNLTEGQKTLSENVSPRDVPQMQGERFVAFSHRNGFLGVMRPEDQLKVTLKSKQDDIVTFSPVKEGVGIIGCYPFYLAPGPILEVVLEEEELHISSLVAAPMFLYCERQILDVKRNGHAIPWEYDSVKGTLSIDSRSHIEEVHAMYHITFE